MKKNLLICAVVLLSVHSTFGQVILEADDSLTFPKSNPNSNLQRNSLIDSDNDGVPDEIDLDDDNDGILDSDECVVAINLSGNSTVLTATDETDVRVGEKVLYVNAIMKDNVYYDIVFTLLEKSNPNIQVEVETGISARYLNAYRNDYIRYKLDLVEKGSATLSNPNGTPAKITDIILTLADVDSYRGYNFTEVTGIEMDLPTSPNSHYLTPGTLLEQNGFVSGGPSANHAMYRLIPLSGTSNWRNNLPSNSRDLENRANYKYDEFTTLNAVFGVTGGYNRALSGVRKNYFDIASPCDEDNDAFVNRIDIDSDNDGIPDNVEAQPTLTYQAPSVTVDANGIPTNYGGTGLSPLVDTDGDGLKDFKDLDSENDGIPDIEENGMANAVIPLDTDGDGLDDAFEGSNINDFADVNDEIDDPTDLTVLPDSDSNLFTGGDLDYRDFITFPTNSIIDFDGVDDYVDANVNMTNANQITLMSWVKLDNAFVNKGHIVGEDLFRITVTNTRQPVLEMLVTYGYGNPLYSATITSSVVLEKNKWYHIAAVFNSSTGLAKLYINGEPDECVYLGDYLYLKTYTAATNNFTMGKLANTNTNLYKGCIDEVRVFSKALTASQIQGMVYQEIVEKDANVSGAIIPKPVIDMSTNAVIPWSALEAYYTFTDVIRSTSPDNSANTNTAYLHYITTREEQTAPMPYKTVSDGAWTETATWLNGDVWDINDISSNKPWGIVNIKNDVSTDDSHQHLGLIIDDGKNLLVNDDNAITNTYYLELNGSIDLQNDSQLVQTKTSDLVTSANGHILRRQEGTKNQYWYNYWGAPIGTQKATSLGNDNALVNNSNNSNFSLGMLKYGDGRAVQFTNAHQETGKISKTWLYNYINGTTYENWNKITPYSSLKPGQGYTQKGTGVATPFQQYIFQGRPNNGTVKLPAYPVSGTTKSTKYLIGNPYPSALDIREFIKDNEGVIYGTVYLWEQWAGNTHVLAEYEGGYGTINLTATVRAYQHSGIPIADQGQSYGVKLPTFNLAVGQGFFTQIVGTGDVTFKNSQRKFVKEIDIDGVNPENGSIFARTSKPLNLSRDYDNYNSEMGIIRLEFATAKGQSRHVVLGFSNHTTDGFDYGYDGKTISTQYNDLNTVLDGRKMTIQAYSPITSDKVVDLIFNSKDGCTYSIKAVQISDISETQEIYLKDNETGEYFDLTTGEAYTFKSHKEGEYPDRFDIVFQKEGLSVAENTITDSKVKIQLKYKLLKVNGLDDGPAQVVVTNILGKVIQTYVKPSVAHLENGLPIDLSSGTYIVSVKKDNNSTITKKVINN